MTRWLAANPDKRHFERLILYYSVIWIGVIVAVQLTRAFQSWGDPGHLALGVGLALPIWIAPLVWPAPSERATPIARRHSTHFNLFVGLFSFLQVYFVGNCAHPVTYW